MKKRIFGSIERTVVLEKGNGHEKGCRTNSKMLWAEATVIVVDSIVLLTTNAALNAVPVGPTQTV